ncbi:MULTISPECIES: GNAT family N-acetyltransferase [unclassified Lentimicrobium]|uniref:GNAT family N-acetyltransferase n=1 Tax=unclassified Lentimicrobium TaxID=2677434 RepID=UPI001551A2DE|nr:MULTISPECIES: GNAT family N-acetyltransferase [unclassified Lentimicrobium]NPD46856.1 GNAT family N-acetyltransferase [Lentimicrobium sp. S6]NPD84439.1 GNAT family N-acetyltransferase [Lentimicrobium sp. L6]
MNYQITNATEKHIEIITDFQLRMALETESIHLDKPTVLKGVSAVFNDKSLGQYFITKDNDKVIASLMITYEWSDWRNAKVWWIQSVFVIPEYRRTGVFSQVYQHIKTIVKEDVTIGGLRLYVDKTNVSAQNTYSKVGMNGEHYQLFEWMK